MSIFGRFRADETGSLVSNVAIIGVAMAILGVGAAHYLAERTRHQAMQLAAAKSGTSIEALRSVLDPPTTGSIEHKATIRLDPCSGERR
jgi:hypothetical protein